jgi:hypothetical protein
LETCLESYYRRVEGESCRDSGGGAGGSAGGADEVGEPDAVEGVAEQGEAGERAAKVGFKLRDAVWVTYGILRQRVGPAADHR